MFLFCSVLFFFLLISQADTSLFLFHLIAENLILPIFLIIMIIIPCSGMFRNVPKYSMFLVLSTAQEKPVVYNGHFNPCCEFPRVSLDFLLTNKVPSCILMWISVL